MPEDGRALGAPAPVLDLRPRRLLRRLAQQARHQAFPFAEAPDHEELRAGRGLGLVLRRRDHVRAGSPALTGMNAEATTAQWLAEEEAIRARMREIGQASREDVAGKSGLEILVAMSGGELPRVPMVATLDFMRVR